jgi:hypothetical protein
LRQAARSQQAAELAAAFEAIMGVHREEFPVATAPVAPAPPAVDQDAIRRRHEQEAMRGIGALHRKARIAARQQAADAAAAEIAAAVTARAEQYIALQGWLVDQWHKLLANDPDVVFATLTEAYEDNEAPAAVISVDSGAASVVIMCPDLSVVPDRMPERTAAGNLAFKKLTKTARNFFCTELVCGRVLATVRETLAVAPALSAVHTAVVRPSAPDAYGRQRPECLLAATFTRPALSGIQWQTASAAQIVNHAATDQRIRQSAYGELQPLNLAREPELAQLVDAIDLDDLTDPSPGADAIPAETRTAIDQTARDEANPMPTPVNAHPSPGRPGSGVPAQPKMPVFVLGGREDLEIVGESFHQPALWQLAHATVGDEVRYGIVAVLVPEPTNQHDPNAIAIHIDGQIIGHLPRAIAREYVPGVRQFMTTRGGYAALHGVIVGGGYRREGPGFLGVWLKHNPADFGIGRSSRSESGPPEHHQASGDMRTGFTEAWRTDPADDSYDLSWIDSLPQADLPAIAKLRELLAHDPDPIDRHFQFTELEKRLYRSRDLYESALTEYDETCVRHDTEMDRICAAFMAKMGKIPVLDTYRQMAIRQQKKQDWQACQWWAERGLAMYGQRAARNEAVEDLIKRRNRAAAKLGSSVQ